MTNLTPEMTEKAKKAKSAELSDDMLGNVAGGTETLRRGNSPGTKPSNNDTSELSDDMLDNVAGGIMYGGETWEVGDRVAVNVRCAYCGKAGGTGVVSVVYRPKRDGIFRVSAAMDCCGGVATYIVSDGQISKL